MPVALPRANGSAPSIAHLLDAQGYALIDPVLSADECDALLAPKHESTLEGSGARQLLSQPWCASLAEQLAKAVQLPTRPGEALCAVQCTYFEKSSDQNWLVPVHQDLSIPVAERIEHPQLRGWSVKEGTNFVQAPCELLERMVAVRLHLDPCGAEDGPLRVVPGSHRLGILSPEEARAVRTRDGEVTCCAAQGSALVLRPLILHASSKSTGRSRRRVLHFLYGPRQLPFGLRWAFAT